MAKYVLHLPNIPSFVETVANLVLGQCNGVDIDITDKGIGIPADEFENIFQPFYRASKEGEGKRLWSRLVYDQQNCKATQWVIQNSFSTEGGTICRIYSGGHQVGLIKFDQKEKLF